jgi:guanylate kinase
MIDEYVFKKPLGYIGGKLNDMCCEYIQNLSSMIEITNDLQSFYEIATSCPGLDILQGLQSGKMGYKEYATNSMENLRRADFMFVNPYTDNSTSLGLKKEIEMCNKWGIPIFYTTSELENYLSRPKILCITGKSGSGKSTIAKYIEDKYKIKMIESHTTRKKRGADDNTHTFHTNQEYNQLDPKDMIAKTRWFDQNEGWVRYCCLKQDVLYNNTYVIDEKGLVELNENQKNNYNIFNLHITRDYKERLECAGETRVNRDEDNFFLPKHYYDYVLENNLLYKTLDTIDDIVNNFFFNNNIGLLRSNVKCMIENI